MALKSMTGFARAEGESDPYRWVWELRSVNGKGLDVRLRLPQGMDALENDARSKIQAGFNRGHIGATLSVQRAANAAELRINHDVLNIFAEAAHDLQKRYPFVDPPSADGLLSLKGVIDTPEDESDEEQSATLYSNILTGLENAIADLASARAVEGGAAGQAISEQVGTIAALREAAAAAVETQRDHLRARVTEAVSQLISTSQGLSAEKLEHEVALLYTKADVREELDRLAAHLEQARTLLCDEKPVGRRGPHRRAVTPPRSKYARRGPVGRSPCRRRAGIRP